MLVKTAQTQKINRLSPLNEYERRLIAILVNYSFREDGIQITWQDVWTLHIDNEANVVWIHLYDNKQLPYDRDQFKAAMESAKKIYAANFTKEMKAKKAARELKEGDRIMFDGKAWTVEAARRETNNAFMGLGDFHFIKFIVVIVRGTKREVLKPYSETMYKLA